MSYNDLVEQNSEGAMKRDTAFNLSVSAMLLAIGYVLPFFTGQIQQIGNMLLPMHFPVMLCGLVCGWKYGLVVGFVMPVTRSIMFGMPALYPNAIGMSFELAAYGFVIGLVFSRLKKKGLVSLYLSLISSMVIGRIIWGISMAALLGIKGASFTVSAFVAGAFLNAVPGIVIQLILIPSIMLALDRLGVVKLMKNRE